MAGFVKLYRQFSNWGWYKDVAVKAVFIELLLSANYEPSEYMGHTVERGQAVFGYASLAERSGVSVQQARTAIKKLQKTGEISVWTNRHFSIATIIKYSDYQQTDNKQSTNNQQTDNKQITSSKKERKEEMKKYNTSRVREGNTPEQDFDDLAGRVISEYNRVCVDLPECTELTMARRRLLYAAKMQDKPLDYFTSLFKKAQASDSICGRGDLAWKGHFDWIIKNAVKIMEGSYDNVTPKKPPDKRGSMFSAEGASFDLAKWERVGLPEGCG